MPPRIRVSRAALLACLVLTVVASAQSRQSVREIMLTAITPATDTLWGVDDPQSDDDWAVLDRAAITVIESAALIGAGGSAAADDANAAESEWQSWTAEMRQAAEAAREAIAARDLDALVEATNVMYPPCEECHIRFHPGVQ